MESPELGPRVKALKEENDLNNHTNALILGSSSGDSITKVWPVTETQSHFCCYTILCVWAVPLQLAFSFLYMIKVSSRVSRIARFWATAARYISKKYRIFSTTQIQKPSWLYVDDHMVKGNRGGAVGKPFDIILRLISFSV